MYVLVRVGSSFLYERGVSDNECALVCTICIGYRCTRSGLPLAGKSIATLLALQAWMYRNVRATFYAKEVVRKDAVERAPLSPG